MAIAGNYAVVGAPGEDVTGNNSGRVYVFDATTGAKIAGADVYLGLGSYIPDRLVFVSGSRRLEMTGSHTNWVTECVVHDLVKKKVVITIELPKGSFSYPQSFSPDGKLMITQRENGELAVWDLTQIP